MNVFIIFGIILLIIACSLFLCDLLTDCLDFDTVYFYLIPLVLFGGTLLWIGINFENDRQELIVQNEIVDTDERTVALKELPEESTYYKLQNDSGDTKIKYLDGKELVTLSIDSYREFYDAENQPYIEIKESKNTYGDVLETNVIIHLKELENE